MSAKSVHNRIPNQNNQKKKEAPRYAAVLLLAFSVMTVVGTPQAQAQTELLSATLVPQDLPEGRLGCQGSATFGLTDHCSTSSTLNNDDFTYDSTRYSIHELWLGSGGAMGNLRISFDTDMSPDAKARLVLVVGTEKFAFKDADTKESNSRTWNNSGLTWSAGTAVNIKIEEGAAVALPSAPRNLEARAGNKKVTLSWDPPDIFGTGGLTKYERAPQDREREL